VDAARKVMLASVAVISMLVFAYAATPWHQADHGLVTFVVAVLVVSGTALGLATWRHRVDRPTP
jgi:hypothetical protein